MLTSPYVAYGIHVCPTNSANRQSLQFTVNRIIYKIFGVITKDSYCEICEYFGIPTVEQLLLLIVMIDSSIDFGVKEIM